MAGPAAKQKMGASIGKGFFEETKEKLVANDPQTIGIVVALFIGLLTLVVLFLWSRKKKYGRGILLCGACDSGKTTLFGQLLQGKPVETYTSMKENSGVLTVAGKRPVNLVDVPGHERIRDSVLDQCAASARGIVFVVDSGTISKQIRDTTEFLFNILSRPSIYASRPSLLVACNKQDLGLVKGATAIQGLLEKEMNALRISHTNRLEGTDGDDSGSSVYLGKQGKDFSFQDLGMDVKFVEVSAQDADTLGPVTDWVAANA